MEVPVFIFIVFIVFRQRPNVQYGFSAQLQPLCGQGLDSYFTALTQQVKGSQECGLSLCRTRVGASPPCVRLQPQLKTSQPSTHYENLHNTKLCLIFQEYSFFFFSKKLAFKYHSKRFGGFASTLPRLTLFSFKLHQFFHTMYFDHVLSPPLILPRSFSPPYPPNFLPLITF